MDVLEVLAEDWEVRTAATVEHVSEAEGVAVATMVGHDELLEGVWPVDICDVAFGCHLDAACCEACCS